MKKSSENNNQSTSAKAMYERFKTYVESIKDTIDLNKNSIIYHNGKFKVVTNETADKYGLQTFPYWLPQHGFRSAAAKAHMDIDEPAYEKVGATLAPAALGLAGGQAAINKARRFGAARGAGAIGGAIGAALPYGAMYTADATYEPDPAMMATQAGISGAAGYLDAALSNPEEMVERVDYDKDMHRDLYKKRVRDEMTSRGVRAYIDNPDFVDEELIDQLMKEPNTKFNEYKERPVRDVISERELNDKYVVGPTVQDSPALSNEKVPLHKRRVLMARHLNDAIPVLDLDPTRTNDILVIDKALEEMTKGDPRYSDSVVGSLRKLLKGVPMTLKEHSEIGTPPRYGKPRKGIDEESVLRDKTKRYLEFDNPEDTEAYREALGKENRRYEIYGDAASESNTKYGANTFGTNTAFDNEARAAATRRSMGKENVYRPIRKRGLLGLLTAGAIAAPPLVFSNDRNEDGE